MLHHLKHVVDKSNTIPVLSCIKLDGERAIGTDLDMMLDVPCPVASLREPLCVPLEPLLKLNAPHLSDEGDGKLTARHGSLCARLDTRPAEEFPLSLAGKLDVRFDGKGLLEIFRLLKPCISTEETRYYLNGVYLEGREFRDGILRAVATDGHKLGHFVVGPEPAGMPKHGAIVPHKAIKVLLSIGSEIELVELSEKYARFYLENGAVLTTLLIDGSFPDYSRVIPKNNKYCLAASRREMLDACKELKRLGLGMSVGLYLDYKELTLRQINPDFGTAEATLFAEWDGPDEYKIGFNLNYLIELLSLIDQATVYFEVGKENQNPVNVGDNYILMPMRV